MTQRKRTPGETNPTADDRALRDLTNTELSQAGTPGSRGHPMGYSYGFLGVLSRWRAHRAKKRAMASEETRRAEEGGGAH